MVGVPKSTGCFVCRKRKIKCDETWPTCMNCRKNGKLCPGPPARHTFKDLGPHLDEQSKSASINRRKACTGHNNEKAQLIQLNPKCTEARGMVLKFRLSRTRNEASKAKRSHEGRSTSVGLSTQPRSTLYNPLPTSFHDELARALIGTMRTKNIGYSISDFGSFMNEVPRRIGRSAALDAAVACLVHTQSAVPQLNSSNDVDGPNYYLAAVQNLQKGLEDPVDGMSSNTLCAAVLLSLVEALAGPRIDNAYLAHVGGAGRLLEIQGPGNCSDDFAKEILHFTRGGIIVTSIYRTEPCFLLSPHWRDIAFDNADTSLEEHLYTDTLHQMAELPALLRDLKGFRMFPIPMVDFRDNFRDGKAFHEDNTVYLAEGFGTDKSSNQYEDTDVVYLSPPDLTHAHTQYPNPIFDYSSNTSLCDSPQSYHEPSHPLLNRAYALKTSLKSTGAQLIAHLHDSSFALELPSTEPSTPRIYNVSP